ncbi:hypothetical protein OAL43_02550 [bacterium]|nr:hypothetical protein [bacterium]MDC0279064.1 hypothetical protein [bacterium]
MTLTLKLDDEDFKIIIAEAERVMGNKSNDLPAEDGLESYHLHSANATGRTNTLCRCKDFLVAPAEQDSRGFRSDLIRRGLWLSLHEGSLVIDESHRLHIKKRN